MTRSGGPSPAEQHLGDCLAALVDGELGHEARERVLAHLATCPQCKAEADVQRRLKSAFAQSPPPLPSESLLARLQGMAAIAAGTDGDGHGDGGAAAPARRAPNPATRPGLAPRSVPEDAFAFLPTAGSVTGGRERGFRIHEMERLGPRRRFAFAAAGAVSLAALALGAALPLDAAVDSSGDAADPVAGQVSAPAGGGRDAGTREGGRRDVGLLAAVSTFGTPGPTPSPTGPAATAHVPAPLLLPVAGALTRPLLSAAPSERPPRSTRLPDGRTGQAVPTPSPSPYRGLPAASD
ncbi:zf-HC2 domain-containing protein [Streptomyces sp. B1866]|uniref:anti-sigma factor family protein n=1 Tax=Streptomyces sp. B1866 TaxID=3075431 RepID=UPI002891D974|nr:zf-HC2 domain-containing protein [Streptomyces sp. B1866]MDT3396230.1 zf-HC2 domain-containing protein [Streptomyces sp. B1866]